MKTLSSLLILCLSIFFLVPNGRTPKEKVLKEKTENIEGYFEFFTFRIEQEKTEIELLKAQIYINISEVKRDLNIPYEERKKLYR